MTWTQWNYKNQLRKNQTEAITLILIFAVLMIFSAVIGCKHYTSAPVPLAPGFANTYDQNTYATLYTAQAGINQAKIDFANNPAAKNSLNAAIKSYNDALAGYNTYHAAVATNPAADHSALDNLLALMLAAIAAEQQQFGTPAKPITQSNFGLQRIEAM